MSSTISNSQVVQTLVDFSSKGLFPEEENLSAAYVPSSTLAPAVTALEAAKADLENEIRGISQNAAPDVDAWITTAKSLQDDIEASRKLAVEVIQQAAADEHREEIIRQREIYESFLQNEVAFNAELLMALKVVEDVNSRLDGVEDLIEERMILEALRALEEVWTVMTKIPAEKSTRVVRMLEQRSYDLKAMAHDSLELLWNKLVVIESGNGSITINKSLPNMPGTINDAVIAFQAYKELDKSAVRFSQSLSNTIFVPRIEATETTAQSKIDVTKNTIKLQSTSSHPSIDALFQDLENGIRFLKANLPENFLTLVSRQIMPDLVTRVKELWLDSSVPSSLADMDNYSASLSQVTSFSDTLKHLGWPGADSFDEWTQSAPKVWLTKRREDALEQVRNGLAAGVQKPQLAEKTETRTVANNDILVTDQDWDNWGSDHEMELEPEVVRINGTPRHENGIASTKTVPKRSEPAADVQQTADEDVDDAWGWNDDVDVEVSKDDHSNDAPSQPEHHPVAKAGNDSTREVTMTEQYWISTLPQPILGAIKQLCEDGATLLQPDNAGLPVASIAAQMFSIPTLVLALFRAVGPVCYANNAAGNLYLYNDTLWLSDMLRQFVDQWKSRTDVPPRAITLLRLDTEISKLEGFGKRAYTNELNAQRTVIKDLLGGTHNFFQDEGSDRQELISRMETVVKHIEARGDAWQHILSPSALSSTLGALVNAVAVRLINDVFDMSSMSVTEAETAATIISIAEKLDTLFVPKSTNNARNASVAEQPIPMTFQYADKWMKMKFLSQTLQSNLTDINYLWFESDLSLYFTAQEVVELIELSFENNPGVRSQIRQIRENPHPRDQD